MVYKGPDRGPIYRLFDVRYDHYRLAQATALFIGRLVVIIVI